jgi:hypothetical protein
LCHCGLVFRISRYLCDRFFYFLRRLSLLLVVALFVALIARRTSGASSEDLLAFEPLRDQSCRSKGHPKKHIGFKTYDNTPRRSQQQQLAMRLLRQGQDDWWLDTRLHKGEPTTMMMRGRRRWQQQQWWQGRQWKWWQ